MTGLIFWLFNWLFKTVALHYNMTTFNICGFDSVCWAKRLALSGDNPGYGLKRDSK